MGVLERIVDSLAGPRCQYCNARRVRLEREEILSEEPGFGVVIRNAWETEHVTESDGTYTQRRRTIQREERVPVVRRTIREVYRCRSCGFFTGENIVYSESEDFG
jgi:DNA-directed RNA polymerase subunit RPC12/RpoP